jgi:hypothetical protein
VKWQEDRSEGFVSDNQGRDHGTRAELALDENVASENLRFVHIDGVVRANRVIASGTASSRRNE